MHLLHRPADHPALDHRLRPRLPETVQSACHELLPPPVSPGVRPFVAFTRTSRRAARGALASSTATVTPNAAHRAHPPRDAAFTVPVASASEKQHGTHATLCLVLMKP